MDLIQSVSFPGAIFYGGWALDTHPPEGVDAKGVHPGTHRWMSDPDEGFPAWIELEWEQPQVVNFIQLVFDTGMHRPLTQTYLQDFYGATLIWGPQPETVKCYRLVYAPPGNRQFVELIAESENYQRRRIHRLPTVAMKKLRLIIEDTWGIDHARVFEIRCYQK